MAKNKQQNGFTLVEAVVTTAIVALMSALVVSGTNGAREKFQVRNAAQQFASSLRETVLLTKNGVNVDACKTVNLDAKRECSSYKVVVPPDGDSYMRRVTKGSNYDMQSIPLLGGARFDTGGAEQSVSFVFDFPNVDGSGGFTIQSKSDPNIKSCVSIVSGGVVSVKNGAC